MSIPNTRSLRFAQALQAKFQELSDLADEGKGYTSPDEGFEVEPGQKFDRIVTTKYGRSVYCFIDRETGDVIKAAGYKAPQKNKNGWAVKYNLATEEGFAEALFNADHSGGFLYGDYKIQAVPAEFYELEVMSA